MTSSGAPVKLASHDLQLATLISMGFEAGAAEQALERNDWKVSESIDYLLAAGIGMNDQPAPPVMHDEDDEKSVERKRLDIAVSTMTPTIAPNSPTRQSLPTLVEDRSREHGTQDHPVGDWIDEPNANSAPSRGRSVRRGDGSVGSADLTPPRRSKNESRSHQQGGRASNNTGQRHARFEDDPLEQPRRSRNNQHGTRTRQTPAEDTHEHHEPPGYSIPPEPRHLPVTYNERDYKPPDETDSLGDPLGFSSAGVPTMASDSRNRMKRRNQHGSADHGVHLSTIEESFPGRDGIEVSRRQVDDDISMVAMAGGARKQSTISSLTGMPSVQEAQCEDAGVSRKDIRRLYVLVCAALVLVLVGIIVAVSLSVTIGKQSAPPPANDLNNTSPTPTVDTTPSPSPADGPTRTVDLGGFLERTTLSETGTQDPIEASTTSTQVTDGSRPPSSTRTMGEQLLDSPLQTLPPIRKDPAPSPAPPDNRRAEQQREEKSQHYLRGN
jgi:hypothetical protein